MPAFRLTAKSDFGSGAKKVGKGSSITLTSGTSNPSFPSTVLKEAIKHQLGIDCFVVSMSNFNVEKL